MFPVHFQIGMHQQETLHFGLNIVQDVADDEPLVGLYTEIGTHNMMTEVVPVTCTGWMMSTARQTAHS